MLILLKIIYKAFYKIRDRKDSAKNAYVGIVMLYLTLTSTIFFVLIMKKMFPYLHDNLMKWIFGCFIFGMGFLLYFRCSTYVKKQFQNETFYDNIEYSVLFCRFILILISLIGMLYLPGIGLYIKFSQ